MALTHTREVTRAMDRTVDEMVYHDVTKIPLILKLTASGLPVSWVHWQDAVNLHWNDKIKWTLGEHKIVLHGGTNAASGQQSTMELAPIIAVNEQVAPKKRAEPLLTNRTLFARDQHLCLYCGHVYPAYKLTRDHIIPTSRGGANKWANAATACKSCNHRKGARTPEEANMLLLAVPYVPNVWEHLLLQNRRILADQQEFLLKGVSKHFKLG